MSKTTTPAEDLNWSIKNGDIDTVRTLINGNPNLLKELDSNQRGPAHWASDFGHVEILKFIIEKKANINAKDKYGITPLLCAAYEGHVSCIELLLKNGADKTAVGPDGSTAEESAPQSAKNLFK